MSTPGPSAPAGPGASYRYGEHPRQVCDLWLPARAAGVGVVVLVHGGGWGAGTDRSDTGRLAADLAGRGLAVLNVDYRGVGDGGGWPTTLTDVATAVDLLPAAAGEHGLDAARAVVVGHSAGGHLALWVAARHRLPPAAPGASPGVRPLAAAAMGGVAHPTAVGDPVHGDRAVVALLGGGPEEVPGRYAHADPARLVPLGLPLLLTHGSADDVVPVSQAHGFARAARAAGDEVRVDVVEGEDHGAATDPSSQTWQRTRHWLEERLRERPAPPQRR